MDPHNRPFGLDPEFYLDRPPERLALQGYRGWTWTVAMRSAAPWQHACEIYRDDLGAHADAALEALGGFVETLGLCARCPLRMRRPCSAHVCSDEVLMLALVAAIQHADDAAADRCLNVMCCPRLAERVAFAAGNYALTLRSVGRLLLPIPLNVVDCIVGGSRRCDVGNRTLH